MSQQQLSSIEKNFANALKKARGNRSQAEFARLLGIKSQQTYQAYESGRVPGGEMLLQISNKLGVTVDELLTGGKPCPEVIAEFDAGKLPIFWGHELEENTQFSIAISAFCRAMSSRQLLMVLNEILDNKRVSEKAKLFWTKIIGSRAVVALEIEEKQRKKAESGNKEQPEKPKE